MKARIVFCIIKGHDWIYGRVAELWARELIPGKTSYHNRACRRCTHEQWNADEIEKEADTIRQVRRMLGGPARWADTEMVDPKDLLCDPNEFP